jgi:hypothetical protein
MQTKLKQNQTKTLKQTKKTKLIYLMLKQTILKIMELIVLWGKKKITNKMYSENK